MSALDIGVYIFRTVPEARQFGRRSGSFFAVGQGLYTAPIGITVLLTEWEPAARPDAAERWMDNVMVTLKEYCWGQTTSCVLVAKRR